jgi:transposase-like protein
MTGYQGQNSVAMARETRLKSWRKFSAEERIRIILEGLKGKTGVSELCRREGIVSSLYYPRSKDLARESGRGRAALLFRDGGLVRRRFGELTVEEMCTAVLTKVPAPRGSATRPNISWLT